MRRVRIVSAALSLIAAAALAAPLSARSEDGAPAVAAKGRPAPAFEAADWIGGDGRTKLADFRGEVVLLVFWTTRCPICCGQVAPLTRLAEDLAKKGLAVIVLTDDERETVERYMAHRDAGFGFPVAFGAAPGYPRPSVPYAALIGADGNVAYLGPPGSLPRGEIEALLRKVPKLTAGEQEARAAAMLATAEKLIAAREVARAESVLSKIGARFGATDSGKRAAARAKEIQTGEFAAEWTAQRELAKLLGGSVEKPAEADRKAMEKLARTLEKKSAEWREKAPKAAELAERWRLVASKPWQ